MDDKSRLGLLLKILIAILCGLLHWKQVSTLFEHDEDFSNQSDIEKEMSFRTEMGMYFSYFKSIADSESFILGISRINHDNISQYPSIIDAQSEYNIAPEIYIGLTYHVMKYIGLTQKSPCWQIRTKSGISTVASCEGIGVPVYFYLEFVWLCSFAVGSTIFLYSSSLSGSITGGIVSFMLYISNYDESTRIKWNSPLLRESFAYPALLFQMYILSELLRMRKTPKSRSIYVDMIILTACCLASWQFSQLVFITQTLSMLLLKWLKRIDKEMYLFYCTVHLAAIVFTTTPTKSILVLKSLHLALLIVTYFSSKLSEYVRRRFESGEMIKFEIILTVVCAKVWGDFFTPGFDNDQILGVFRSKLFGYKNFHSMLSSCSPEMDFFLDDGVVEISIKTFLLPSAILSLFLVLYFWYRNGQIQGFPNCVEPDVAYNFLQLKAIATMSIFVPRLQLFLMPLLCVFAGLASSRRYLNKLKMSALVQVLLVGLLFFLITYKFSLKIGRDRAVEPMNSDREELLQWIKGQTRQDSAFAGTMSVMASVMLSTGRPVVNNPFYDSREMQDRTRKVYEVFGRKTPDEVHDILEGLKVDYLVLDYATCLANEPRKRDCQILEIWDLVDEGKAKNEGKVPVCLALFSGHAHPFRKVFENRSFVILQLNTVQTVEYTPKIISLKS
ncbi:hypothetical protein QAD02_022899 [Eretmocerus hayati]|uniref:Uncharacterized protein n=1 Tax=Eretmocerus hayati TaxID=131215 RepID=A0ACC2PZ75_9HYME|nr:hypothetical protein QAD02_022899 [Eretmocerus hayati]